ncbi:MAG: mechanosensitive ion channel [Bacteroidota bacterium]|nr:mechanosensitive ion channel [Bacteroidota bacterium]
MKQWLKNIEEILRPLFEYETFTLGKTSFTVGTIFYLLFTLFLLFYFSEKLRLLLTRRILVKYNIVLGVRQAIGTIVKYIIIVIGLMVIVESTGFDLSTLGLIAGALGVGIGFGLQNITNNFISGIIILFERPVKIGDRIAVGDVTGNIIKIAPRATTVITNDNIAIVVPNSEFINTRVINWSLNDRNVRFNFPIGVAYTEDPEKVRKLILEVVKENPGVQKLPKPDVLFDSFGSSSLDFILRVWTSSFSDNPNVLKSQLYFSIFEKFKENNIKIPYPQRDLHLVSGFENFAKQPDIENKKEQQ